MRNKVANNIRTIFNAPNSTDADRYPKITMEKYKKSAPDLANWIEENISESLTVSQTER